MGMYTEVLFRATLVKDLPEGVLSALHSIVDGAENPQRNPQYELFDCPRWEWLGNSNSAYFPIMAESALKLDSYSKQYGLVLHANLKNYHGEIGKFFDWIDPYIDASPGEFLGYELYEDVEPGTPPTFFFKRNAA